MKDLWRGLLNLKAKIDQYEGPIDHCWLNYITGTVLINEAPATIKNFLSISLSKVFEIPTNQVSISIIDYNKVSFFNTSNFPENKQQFLEKYLPYCFLSIQANQNKRAVSVAHFAQTLDGKISTRTGDSKWIGNKENLLHAHRMRALCDGVLVGSKTLKTDAPKLTVRHVEGTNPIRIILGNPHSNFESLKADSTTPILVFCNKEIPMDPAVTYFHFETTDTWMDTKAILEKLYQLGIASVYIEGGASTTSHFLQTQSIAILQLHIAPIIFGSGTNGIQLQDIHKVGEGIQFQHFYFQSFGDSMMFTGFLEHA